MRSDRRQISADTGGTAPERFSEEIDAAAKKVLGLSWCCAKGFVNEKQAFVAVNRYQRSTMEHFCAEYQRIAAALAGSDLTTPVKDLLAR